MKEPKIRFNGFEGEWETNKLNLLVNRVTRKNSKLESKLPLTISATNGLVSQLEYFNNIVAGSNITNYYLILISATLLSSHDTTVFLRFS